MLINSVYVVTYQKNNSVYVARDLTQRFHWSNYVHCRDPQLSRHLLCFFFWLKGKEIPSQVADKTVAVVSNI